MNKLQVLTELLKLRNSIEEEKAREAVAVAIQMFNFVTLFVDSMELVIGKKVRGGKEDD